jgi:hypothetical protein
MHTYKPDRSAQPETERMLQLLCLIAQSLSRIEAHLAGTPQQRSKIVAFTGRRR